MIGVSSSVPPTPTVVVGISVVSSLPSISTTVSQVNLKGKSVTINSTILSSLSSAPSDPLTTNILSASSLRCSPILCHSHSDGEFPLYKEGTNFIFHFYFYKCI